MLTDLVKVAAQSAHLGRYCYTICCMDASDSFARHRWGTRRVDAAITLLEERRSELGAPQVEAIAGVAARRPHARHGG
jgi:hypothetical protein